MPDYHTIAAGCLPRMEPYMFKKEIYQARRNRLKQQIGAGLVLLPANSESPYTGPGCSFPFRQDSSFLYFCGVNRPDDVLLIDVEAGTDTLFGTEASGDAIFWTGLQPSLADECQKSGIGHNAPISKLPQVLAKARNSGRKVHLLPPYRAEVSLKLQQLLQLPLEQIPTLVSQPLIQAVIQQRSIKDEFEIKEIETAVNIARQMHTTAMLMAMPGAHEQDIKGVIEGLAVSKSGSLSFQPIVTTRGDVLHNPRYTNTLENGKLLIVDAGADSPLRYSSDITRTIPVGRTFTRMQRSIYEIVLKANLEAIAAVKPGVPFRTIHLQAALTIACGLKDLGIMKCDPEAAVQEGAHALFFPHGLGHMMGLDTHDMEALGEEAVGYGDQYTRSPQFGLNYLRLAKPLAAGNVITIEPGIYLISPLIAAWKQENKHASFINYNQVDHFLGMGGVRIEDDILVTESGSQVLGKPIPKTIREIESL